MCLAIPARMLEALPGERAVVDLGGIRKTVSVALTPEAAVGDYLIIHVGYAIGRLDEAQAERTLAILAEAGVMEERR